LLFRSLDSVTYYVYAPSLAHKMPHQTKKSRRIISYTQTTVSLKP
jgi:hypothetical protein